jgi:hypothetical protein
MSLCCVGPNKCGLFGSGTAGIATPTELSRPTQLFGNGSNALGYTGAAEAPYTVLFESANRQQPFSSTALVHFRIYAANNNVFIVRRANGVAGLVYKCWNTTIVPPYVMLGSLVCSIRQGDPVLLCAGHTTRHHGTARHGTARHISHNIRSNFRSCVLVAVRTEDRKISWVERQTECAFVESVWKCVY